MLIDQQAEPALKKLLRADDLTLLEQLGLRGKAVQMGSPEALRYDPVLVHDSEVMGPLDDLRELGRRLLARWSRELYTVVCGNAQVDQKDRESLLKALGLGDLAVAGALTAVLVTSFAVPAAIATVVAALLVKRVIDPGGETVCQFWGEQLNKG